MWRKEDEKSQDSPELSPAFGTGTTATATTATLGKAVSGKAPACISQGIRIKGEVTGSEDLFVDGQFEGKLTFSNCSVTIGPNAAVKAEVTGRELIIRGRVDGKLTGSERVQVWHTARVNGDVKADKISIEEGAELHGKLEAGKAPLQPETTRGSSKKSEGKPKEADAPSGAAVAGAD